MKMKIFIGSASEAIVDLDLIASWIEEFGHEAISWRDTTVFTPGLQFFTNLVDLAHTVDAAIFLFSEDDKVEYRSDFMLQPRDNVMIEYGLFLGVLGASKVIFCRKGKPKTASDLNGVTYIDVSEDRLRAARVMLRSWMENIGRQMSIQAGGILGQLDSPFQGRSKTGIVHGRFQPIHNGHIAGYINLARPRCEHLIVGITNPDPTHTLPDPVNASRTSPQNNPLNFYERLSLVQAALIGEGFARSDFHVVPFPINFPQLLRYYVPEDAVHFLTIFDEWGLKKRDYLENHGCKVDVLLEKDISEKTISATEVRDRILKDRNWRELVPRSTHTLLDSMNIKDRIRKLKELAL